MARQQPRKRPQAFWIECDQPPREVTQKEVLPAIITHQQANPWCWACGAAGTETAIVASKTLNALGGNVSFYTLCQRCAADPDVRRRVEADIAQDDALAEQTRNN